MTLRLLFLLGVLGSGHATRGAVGAGCRPVATSVNTGIVTISDLPGNALVLSEIFWQPILCLIAYSCQRIIGSLTQPPGKKKNVGRVIVTIPVSFVW